MINPKETIPVLRQCQLLGLSRSSFIERLWRSVKYEEVYLKAYQTMKEARQNLISHFTFYNQTRLHQNLDYQTPDMVYYGKPEVKLAA